MTTQRRPLGPDRDERVREIRRIARKGRGEKHSLKTLSRTKWNQKTKDHTKKEDNFPRPGLHPVVIISSSYQVKKID